MRLIETDQLRTLAVHTREEEIGDIDRAFAELRAATTDDERASAQERLDAAAIDAVRRGVHWVSIAPGLGGIDPRTVRARYENRI